MKWMRALTLTLAGFVAGHSLPAMARADISLFSMNCYCFPEFQTSALKAYSSIRHFFDSSVKVTNLQSGISQSVPTRIKKIAGFVKQQGPDVVFFQELWGRKNKQLMNDTLSPTYQCYFNHEENSNPSIIDDGLLVATTTKPFYRKMIVYNDRYDDETYARKGALFIGIRDAKGVARLFINTHLQSGTADRAVVVKAMQIRQVCQVIKEIRTTVKELSDAPVVFAGDLNEPILWQKDKHRIIDRVTWLANDFGINLAKLGVKLDLSVSQRLQELCRQHNVEDVAEIYQAQHRGLMVHIDKDTHKRTVTSELAQSDPVMGRLGIGDLFTYWPQATEPRGFQILDHVLVENDNTVMKNFRIFRKDILGDPNPKDQSHYDGKTALSDHAAIMVDLVSVK